MLEKYRQVIMQLIQHRLSVDYQQITVILGRTSGSRKQQIFSRKSSNMHELNLSRLSDNKRLNLSDEF